MTITTGTRAKFARLSALLTAVVALAAATPAANAADSNAARSAIGLKIAPVPLDLKGLNKADVGLGSYLVTVAQCNGCHTKGEFAPGGDPFNGQPFKVVKSAYFAGGAFFGGTLCSSNITPDKNGLPDGLTLAHFLSAMKTGHDFRDKPGVLMQAMPWPYFRSMINDDLTAVYAYLQALPSNKTPKCP